MSDFFLCATLLTYFSSNLFLNFHSSTGTNNSSVYWEIEDQRNTVIVKTGSVFFNCVWYCTSKEDERCRETAEIGENIIESGLH